MHAPAETSNSAAQGKASMHMHAPSRNTAAVAQPARGGPAVMALVQERRCNSHGTPSREEVQQQWHTLPQDSCMPFRTLIQTHNKDQDPKRGTVLADPNLSEATCGEPESSAGPLVWQSCLEMDLLLGSAGLAVLPAVAPQNRVFPVPQLACCLACSRTSKQGLS